MNKPPMYRMTLLLVQIIYCVEVIRCAPGDIKNDTYVLATVLFYNDTNGAIRISSSPVPEIVYVAVRNDIIFRMNGSNIKIVPIFNTLQDVPKSLDVLNYTKSKYKTVYMTNTASNRFSRNILEDIWNGIAEGYEKFKSLFNQPKQTEDGVAAKHNMPNFTQRTYNYPYVFMQTKPTNYYNQQTYAENKIKPHPILRTKVVTTKDFKSTAIPNITETAIVGNNSINKNSTDDLNGFMKYVPYGIFYSLEKKCVNWTENCNNTQDVPI